MVHPLVSQLRFTRKEWQRALQDVNPEEASRRFEPINSISWMVGHLASHEQNLWLRRAQNKMISEAVTLCASGKPASNPSVVDMWTDYHRIIRESEAYLDTLTSEKLQAQFDVAVPNRHETIGTSMHRLIYHYWYHLGESQAVRQLLGHDDLPSFVGDMSSARYTPE